MERGPRGKRSRNLDTWNAGREPLSGAEEQEPKESVYFATPVISQGEGALG